MIGSDDEIRTSNEFGFVVIGRNEGDRLKCCLMSIPIGASTVYVDSGSSDGSVEWAKGRGIEVVELDTSFRFTAARARNSGFRRLQRLAPKLTYVQFIDGDCELVRDWPRQAASFLDNNNNVCAVFGRRRERYASKSIYNRLCDIEWDVPVGEVKAFGGDVMVRIAAFDAVGGFRDELIAGEEPELGVRLRAKNWKIWQTGSEMTVHDAAITRVGQWWRRNVRSGYAFAEGAYLHGAPPERHWVKEANRALLWGTVLPLLCILATVMATPWGAAVWLIYPAQMLRLLALGKRKFTERALLAGFQVLGRFPEGQGYLQFKFYRLLKRSAMIIEYK